MVRPVDAPRRRPEEGNPISLVNDYSPPVTRSSRNRALTPFSTRNTSSIDEANRSRLVSTQIYRNIHTRRSSPNIEHNSMMNRSQDDDTPAPAVRATRNRPLSERFTRSNSNSTSRREIKAMYLELTRNTSYSSALAAEAVEAGLRSEVQPGRPDVAATAAVAGSSRDSLPGPSWASDKAGETDETESRQGPSGEASAEPGLPAYRPEYWRPDLDADDSFSDEDDAQNASSRTSLVSRETNRSVQKVDDRTSAMKLMDKWARNSERRTEPRLTSLPLQERTRSKRARSRDDGRRGRHRDSNLSPVKRRVLRVHDRFLKSRRLPEKSGNTPFSAESNVLVADTGPSASSGRTKSRPHPSVGKCPRPQYKDMSTTAQSRARYEARRRRQLVIEQRRRSSESSSSSEDSATSEQASILPTENSWEQFNATSGSNDNVSTIHLKRRRTKYPRRRTQDSSVSESTSDRCTDRSASSESVSSTASDDTSQAGTHSTHSSRSIQPSGASCAQSSKVLGSTSSTGNKRETQRDSHLQSRLEPANQSSSQPSSQQNEEQFSYAVRCLRKRRATPTVSHPAPKKIKVRWMNNPPYVAPASNPCDQAPSTSSVLPAALPDTRSSTSTVTGDDSAHSHGYSTRLRGKRMRPEVEEGEKREEEGRGAKHHRL